MATLDKVMDLQRQGVADQEIAIRLQTEGVSPREVYDALNQARIKNAVSPPSPNDFSQDMQPSIMPGQETQQASYSGGQSAPYGSQTQSYPPMAAPPGPEMYPPEQGYPQGQGYDPNSAQGYYPQAPQAYDQASYYDPNAYAQQPAIDTETISEVAEQVASEKINEFKKSIGDIVLFKSVVQDKLSELDDRLRRIESSIDKMQHAILGKVGEFGDSSAMIHKDLSNLHNTVSKLMNPLVDNYNELKKLNEKGHH